MMDHYKIGDMGFITACLKAAFTGLFTAVCIGMVAAGVIVFPDPEAAIWAGTGLLCLAMVALAWAISPIPPRWPL